MPGELEVVELRAVPARLRADWKDHGPHSRLMRAGRPTLDWNQNSASRVEFIVLFIIIQQQYFANAGKSGIWWAVLLDSAFRKIFSCLFHSGISFWLNHLA